MRKQVLNVDLDTETRWHTWEEDGEPLLSVLARTFGAANQPASSVPKRLLTDVEAAAYLGVSQSAVRAFVANGELKRTVMPSTDGRGMAARLLRIDRKDLDAFIERSKG